MKFHKQLLKANPGRIFTAALVAFFVCAAVPNLICSQNISPLYFGLINEDRGSIITYLINIKNTPLFAHEYLKYKNNYGGWVEGEVFKVGKQRDQKIQTLEGALNKNQQSRDVLYELSVLYKEKGDEQKGLEYYQRARAVDPSL